MSVFPISAALLDAMVLAVTENEDCYGYKITKDYGLTFSCRSRMLFITLPSGRNLAYVKPKIGTNRFGGSCITR
ncbi:MAG: hypothetical protein LUE12_02590 [Ruminococcus sp.]|nr:hypothetical protein [Ruminococcus sp.]